MTFALDLQHDNWNRKILENISACNIDFVSKADADIIAKRAEFITPEDLDSGSKFIAIEKTDAANVSHRHILKHPSVIRYVKQYNYNSYLLHNHPCVEGRYFTRWLSNEQDFTYPKIDITQTDFDKIVLGWNFLHNRGMMQPIIEKNIDVLNEEERPLDVFFAGSLDYDPGGHRKSGVALTEHRKGLIKRLQEFKRMEVAIVPGKLLRRHIYDEALYYTKIIVSPWGWGECCFRDYEALLAGCILIKPRTDYVQSSCGIFEKPLCIWTAPDFSDLEETIRFALLNWEKTREERLAKRQAIIDHFYKLPSLVRSVFENI